MSETFEELIQNHKLPNPPGIVQSMRYSYYREEWWCKVDNQWYWLDDRTKKEWMPSQYGPG